MEYERACRIKILSMAWIALVLMYGSHLACAAEVFAPLTNFFPTAPLSLAEAVDLTLTRSPAVLRAQQQVEATEGVAIQTRAVALPKLRASGFYQAIESSAVDSPPFELGEGFTFGTDESWETGIRLIQSLYEGGRLTSGVRSSRLLRQQSVLNYQAAVADAVFEVQSAYFAVLLAEQQIDVRQASVELLEQELADTTRRYDAGTVPRFNVLRAEVELANARPALIRTRNAHRIAKDQLATFLGFDAPREATGDIPLILSGKLEALPWTLALPEVISTALSRRTELEALRKAQALRWEDVVSAKARYKPSVQAFAGYEARSTIFSPKLSHEVHGWVTGVQLSWDIFDGGLTRGRVKEAEAQYRRSSVELDDGGRQVELEARSAHSAFVEAQEVLQSQEKVLEAAEEALRLARARYETGTGTQLDVLGAQTALTEARTTQVQALYGYAVARARLERATGLNLPSGSVGTPAAQ